MSRVEELQRLFLARGEKLAVAESCSGGRIASLLTAPAGASGYFLGSLVVYSNEFKESFAQIPAATIQEKGAVSQEVVEGMVRSLLQNTSADWALAVSGIAGPTGGSPQKPVGTVWAALAQRNAEVDSFLLHLEGDREQIMAATAERVLERLLQKLRSL